MAYKLDFSLSSHVYLVFHVSLLKNIIGDTIPVQTILPKMNEEEKIILEPETILETRITQIQNKTITKNLIKWKNPPIYEETWEDEFFI
jgi:hypothetical protein